MIPRKIHYCWFGGAEMGKRELSCMESWKKYCPDYEFIRWDETNVELESARYAQQAYRAKKWAFVSDYVRLEALLEHGGIYMDTDVELRKPLDTFLHHKAFMGFENESQVATCLIGAEAGHPFIRKLLQEYQNLLFVREDGSYDNTTNVRRVSAMLSENGLRGDGSLQTVFDVCLYPQRYFSPKDLETGKITISNDTYAIHHFRASWMPMKNKINMRLAQMLGSKRTRRIKQLLGRE